METKTNVVLIHGAWADGSSWSSDIPLLQKKGLNAVAAQLPLTSLDDDIEVTKNLLATLKGSVMLVGHSYGGIVVSGAANDVPNVKAAAVRPPDYHCFLWIDQRAGKGAV